MSLSPEAIARELRLNRPAATQANFTFPLILLCIALALIVISSVFSPVTLETPGIEKFPGRSLSLRALSESPHVDGGPVVSTASARFDKWSSAVGCCDRKKSDQGLSHINVNPQR